MKNGKKLLTNAKKGDKIVNCIIIARTVGFTGSCRILYSGKLHKKPFVTTKKDAMKHTLFGAHQIFEWSD